MIPSPHRLSHHDFSKPIPLASQTRGRKRKSNLQVVTSKAYPTRYSYQGYDPAVGPLYPDPQPNLVLPAHLVYKIQTLLLISQKIEGLARSIINGYWGNDIQNISSQIDSLEGAYEVLRVDVESGLKRAWLNAGLVPTDIPTFPPVANSTARFLPNQDHRIRQGESIDQELKRKRDAAEVESKAKESNKRRRKNKSKKTVVEDHDGEGWVMPGMLQPLGVPKAAIPLKAGEKQNMRTWGWDRAWKNHEMRINESMLIDGEVSPKGTVFVF
ncbi:hypothetical protein B0J11DRAFT_582307 [Dendryphion nanum]|uniref:Uncharacterized protein n=1 Tax=Dendryphion nanum TaxID=256645 RepID=A0A9P9DID7_9PLEO|nr:hypothetical protein B0J11DRAFT_582307 [Dendryphion nanum]